MRRGWMMALGLLGGCAMTAPVAAPGPDAVIEQGASRMVVSANPLATMAGLDVLRAGGTAVDAAVAVQAVLGLVEPQASGLLGGIVILVADPSGGAVQSFDGMATAPAAATKSVSLGRTGTLLNPAELAFSPRAVGVPGVLPALWAAHQAGGRLPWGKLFARAIDLAQNGAPMPAQLHAALTAPGADTGLAGVRKPYLDATGQVIAVGASFRNPAYATVLRRVARLGPEGLYADGGMAAALVALNQGRHASLIVAADLAGASPRIGAALCAPWQGMRLCTAQPPTMGGVVMLQILGTVPPGDPADPAWVHRVLEASRLAEADRRRYMADPAFVDVPTTALLDPTYLAERASLIMPGVTIARPLPGADDGVAAGIDDPHAPQSATSSAAIVDGDGRVLAMTSTINLHFGARIGWEGMVFNDALLNFAPPPPTTLAGQGGHYANEMAPGKRPVSPIAPVIALDAGGRAILAGGGAGGPPIPDTMAVLLSQLLARHVPLAEALAQGHFHAADPDHIALEDGTGAAALRPALEAAGHRVELEPVQTGQAVLMRAADGWSGRADPRRDGGPALGLR